MTPHEEDLPGINEARQAAEESWRRAEEEFAQAHARAKWTRSLAARLRRLREENGFGEFLEDAFGGGGRA
ncbi:hypothetical protein ACFQVD_26400 [Streptosporangium amethystogenes subsp. fukuiense]|uniref:Uncharacterized protein n=1 Tax=Streptosporangium amethystogenes subsp. fukuiense TaxID=698418 RepID=A0ABW2T5F2_9ACTN